MKSIKRTFIPGSEWLYIKLYMGNNTADKILSTHILYIITQLTQKNLIKKWFFIRYVDTDFHIRLRFLRQDESSINDILMLLYKHLSPLINDNLIWRVQLDTYNRELERYGNELIELSETIFYYDSNCILSIIKNLQDKSDNYRWMIALKMIDYLLSDFSYDIKSKKEIIEGVSNSFKNEFGFNQYNSKQFNSKYRENRKNIEMALSGDVTDIIFEKMCIPIEKKSKKIMLIVPDFEKEVKRLGIIKNDLILSYIHMILNRLFKSKNRIYELVIYDFMRRYYESEIARNRYMIQ